MPVYEVWESEVFLMWVVIAEYIMGKLMYYVENTETGKRYKTYDCQVWAQKAADELNKEVNHRD